ncbi:hypothetical protein FEM48_Zijuj01G0161200 [Ziziphus jujuba var. spinosa]|uniref:Mitochondrial protein n=1 Tax=Ziziphus jujuba var. spinosa TaxID=714518 RepID=A0A978W283_ZIZJJ|nr:hypothetical protein FEM48_Zijuj01G0161200 [Ziziphus jujuba var. spinosa]
MAHLVEEKEALPRKNLYVSRVTLALTLAKISSNTSVGILGAPPSIRTMVRLPDQPFTNAHKLSTQEDGHLGHVISRDGVHIETAKIQSMHNLPQPTTARELHGFLGLAGFYRKFIKGYGGIATPLNLLLSREGF